MRADWRRRWESLSHGERKRSQIAVALWRAPRILAVDEPTNHLDAGARSLVIAALRSFSGVGILVSHDRELLEALCGQCVFVEPPDAIMRPGGPEQGMAEASREVLGGPELRTDADVVAWPDRFSDGRGRRMWKTVTSILAKKVGTTCGPTSWDNLGVSWANMWPNPSLYLVSVFLSL